MHLEQAGYNVKRCLGCLSLALLKWYGSKAGDSVKKRNCLKCPSLTRSDPYGLEVEDKLHCIPQEELDHLEGKSDGNKQQQSILSFTETVQRPEEWSKEQLHECIIRFIIETDQALSIVDHDAFWELLHYNGCSKTKDSDIPHRMKVTEDVIECAEAIRADLTKELQIQNITSDNVTVNDKSMQIVSSKLKADKIDFIAAEQCSHCFSHAIALAKGRFLAKLLPALKKTAKGQPADLSSHIASYSQQAKLVARLLLKVCRFIAKVRWSLQAKKYFKKCCIDAIGNNTLEFLPYCKTRWGSWHGVITHLLVLKMAVKTFLNTADDSEDVPKVNKGQPKYEKYKPSEEEWKLLTLIHEVLVEAAKVQEMFSAEYYPTIWQILPSYKYLLAQWSIEAGIKSLKKYYNKTDNSPVHVVSMYLNPCLKDEFFMVAWTVDGQEALTKEWRHHKAELAAQWTAQKKRLMDNAVWENRSKPEQNHILYNFNLRFVELSTTAALAPAMPLDLQGFALLLCWLEVCHSGWQYSARFWLIYSNPASDGEPIPLGRDKRRHVANKQYGAFEEH
ncbi:hypothetical protein EV424DRAFT_1556667 [Suillus variegatus]|nr:hypothetical protein EV424DRAFT_1556667 [Suillus variegatus]